MSSSRKDSLLQSENSQGDNTNAKTDLVGVSCTGERSRFDNCAGSICRTSRASLAGGAWVASSSICSVSSRAVISSRADVSSWASISTWTSVSTRAPVTSRASISTIAAIAAISTVASITAISTVASIATITAISTVSSIATTVVVSDTPSWVGVDDSEGILIDTGLLGWDDLGRLVVRSQGLRAACVEDGGRSSRILVVTTLARNMSWNDCLGNSARAVRDDQSGSLGDDIGLSVLDDYGWIRAVGGDCCDNLGGVDSAIGITSGDLGDSTSCGNSHSSK